VNLPACNSYDVELQIRRSFRDTSRGTSNIVMFSDVRELPAGGNVRRCSAEVLLSRTWARSPNEYIEYQVNGGIAGWTVTVTHEEDL
jgi:hypothetical protein